MGIIECQAPLAGRLFSILWGIKMLKPSETVDYYIIVSGIWACQWSLHEKEGDECEGGDEKLGPERESEKHGTIARVWKDFGGGVLNGFVRNGGWEREEEKDNGVGPLMSEFEGLRSWICCNLAAEDSWRNVGGKRWWLGGWGKIERKRREGVRMKYKKR